MNAEVKKAWVAALRSGEYKQGKFQLAINDDTYGPRHCCLGVLCELAVKGNVIEGFDANNPCLPEQVYRWGGLDCGQPFVVIDNRVRELAAFNDGGVDEPSKSFTEIADLIEKYL